jgi:hypothetical protein
MGNADAAEHLMKLGDNAKDSGDYPGSSDDLFFTAGINGEADGLFGKITRAK